MSGDPVKRFWAKVDKNGACWLWTGAKGAKESGYGQIWIGKLRQAHRVSWELANGPIPDGLCVLHRCDIRACINPAHLVLGTNAENVADRNAKGRQARGSKNGRAKIVEADIPMIRYLVQRHSQRAVAAAYELGPTVVSEIFRRKSWNHV